MLYAAYGSNLHPFRLQQRTPSAKLVGTSAIAHHTLRFHKRGYRDFSGKCNLVSQHNSIAYIAIYDVPSCELALLDKAEGAGAGYDRTTLSVEGFGDCLIYLANAAHVDETLLPFSWYKNLVIAGCEYLRFPSDYVKKVLALKSVLDPDSHRHAFHTKLVEQCRGWSSCS